MPDLQRLGTWVFGAMIFFLFPFTAGSLAGQVPGSRDLIVAVPVSFPQLAPGLAGTDARAIVLRYPAGKGGDVIVLRPDDLQPETLRAAVRLLERLRAQTPDPEHVQVVVVTSHTEVSSEQVTVDRRYVDEVRRLREQPEVQVGNLGRGKWIRVSAGLVR